MKSKVYFIKVENAKDIELLGSKLKIIINKSKILEDVKKRDFVAIKLTFGEKGNAGFINPKVIKILVDKIKSKAGLPFLTDTNVLYKGSRDNAIEHLMLAYEHGFDIANVGAPVVIADGLLGENVKRFEVKGQKNIEYVSAPSFIPSLDYLVAVAHITGHIISGFAGAIKNIGMGFASRAGKQIQHSSVKPEVISSKCTLCKACINLCPVNAISIRDDKAYINPLTCIGCAECISVCKFNAVKEQWEENVNTVSQRMTEYCYGILSNIPDKVFINFATHMTKQCDCLAKDDPSITADLGILASKDIVALDKATWDLIVARDRTDPFKKLHPDSNFNYQLEYAAKIGVGSLDYELLTV